MRETPRCISCLEEATVWSGHVLKDKEAVMAGHCELHKRDRAENMAWGRKGCYGQWREEYGIAGKPPQRKEGRAMRQVMILVREDTGFFVLTTKTENTKNVTEGLSMEQAFESARDFLMGVYGKKEKGDGHSRTPHSKGE